MNYYNYNNIYQFLALRTIKLSLTFPRPLIPLKSFSSAFSQISISLFLSGEASLCLCFLRKFNRMNYYIEFSNVGRGKRVVIEFTYLLA